MEREHTFGAVMVLVVIFVIVLMIFVMYPPLFEDIKQIAQESFGFMELEEKKIEREKREENVLGLMESIVNCKSYLKEGEGCLCKLEEGDFSGTTLGIEWENGERVVKAYDKNAIKIDSKELKDIDVGVIEEPKKIAKTKDVIDIVFDEGMMKIKDREMTNLVYVYGKSDIFFIPKKREDKFKEIKLCESRKTISEERKIDWEKYAKDNSCEIRAKTEEHYKQIMERIKDDGYEVITRDGERRKKEAKKSYLEIIEESLDDINRKWYKPWSYFVKSDKEEIELIIGVMATESAGINFQEANEAGAKGLMQFMPGTAYDYGLCDRKKVGKKNGKDIYEYCTERDERGDAAKAIEAAAKYLRDLKKNLENGNYCGKGFEQEGNDNIEILQIASYNSGPKPICEAIKRAEVSKPGWLKVRENIKGYQETVCYVYYVQDYKKNLGKYLA